MKYHIPPITVILVLITLFTPGNNAKAQCKVDECVKEIGDDYTFLKSYKMEKISDNDIEKSYVFSKDTHYILNLCNTKQVRVTLYNSEREEIASNYNKKEDKFYNTIAYQCQSTGIYYIKFSFEDRKDCCVSVLGFKK